MSLQLSIHHSGQTVTSVSAFVMCPSSALMGTLQGPPLAQVALHPMYACALALAQRQIAQETLRRPYPPRLNLN